MSAGCGCGRRRRRVRLGGVGRRRWRERRGSRFDDPSRLVELEERVGELEPWGRVRRPGAGRKPMTRVDPGLPEASGAAGGCRSTRGDPERPLRWTSKSVAKLADGLRALGHQWSDASVRAAASGAWVQPAGEPSRPVRALDHPDRDAQFQHINQRLAAGVCRGAAGDLRGHQEEGAGRRFQERRP